MLKRFIARLLILSQVYNCVFQGVAHANVIQAHHAVRDEIYLHTAPSKDGGLRIALGTNRIGDAGGQELLDVIEVPSYQSLSKTAQDQLVQKRIDLKAEVQPDSDLDLDQDSGLDDDAQPAPLFSKSGVTRSPEGAHFTLQGLEIFINNAGEALIQGMQTDFSMPIFLSWGGAVILSDVHAKALQITAPKIFGRGKSIIEELVLEGSTHDGSSTFINGGALTAKEFFLKNLTSRNNGSISAPHLLVDEEFTNEATGSLAAESISGTGCFHNLGRVETDKTLALSIKRFSNAKGRLKARSITGLDSLEIFTNHESSKVDALEALGFAPTTKVVNQGELAAQTMTLESAQITQRGSLSAQILELTGSDPFENFGKIEADQLVTAGVLVNHGQLTTHQSIHLIQGLTIAEGAVANLHGFKLTDGEIINNGKLGFLGLSLSHKLSFMKILNGKKGQIAFEPDLATKTRYLQSGMDAEVEESTDVLIGDLINQGSITSVQNLGISVAKLANTGGHIHGSGKLAIKTAELANEGGSLSGVQGTTVAVEGAAFNNKNGEIGAGGKTYVSFTQSPQNAHLGKIQGKQTCVEDLSGASDATFDPGELIGLEFVRLIGSKMFLPGTTIRTPKLYLRLLDFLIDTRTSPKRTIIERTADENFKLTHPYLTAGTLEIREPGIETQADATQAMLERFGVNYERRPAATHTINIQAPITAKRGMVLYAPAAAFRYGDDALESVYELLLEKAALQAYVSAFDFAKGTLAAKRMVVHAPLGIHFGRLIQDPTVDIFATFSSHSQCANSHNLGHYITLQHYEFLGQKIGGVYLNGFLLALPKARLNQTNIQVKESSQLRGTVLNRSVFATHDLSIDSAEDSILEASSVSVRGNFTQLGLGKLLLKRHIGNLRFIYHRCGDAGDIACVYPFMSSDPARLMVYGELHQAPTSEIINDASILYAQQPQQAIKVKSVTQNTCIFQKEYTREEQARLSLMLLSVQDAIYYPGWQNITHPMNGHTIYGNGCVTYANGFLQKTSNFSGAKSTFVAETSYGNGVVLGNHDGQLTISGDVSAPLMLIRVSKGQVVLGTQNPFYIEPKDPIRDLMAKGFNAQNTFVTPDIRKLIEQQFSPQFFFKMRERFFYHARDAQAFYQDINDHIVVYDANHGFKKASGKTIFSLSPEKLLEVVRRECQETLHRGYFDDHQTIDYTYLKTLHRNASTYLTDHNLVGQELSQALVVKGDRGIALPTEPIIFYETIMGEDSLEQLVAKLYVPTAMIDDARGKRGGKIRTHVLAILPDGMSQAQILECFRESPSVQSRLSDFFASAPLAIQDVPDAEQAVQELPAAELMNASVKIYGEVEADLFGAVVPSNITIHGNIQAKKALIASLFGDVILESLVQKTYLGDPENFTHVALPARISALDTTLDILAKRSVVFVGAQTYSQQKTYVEALANIYDLPVTLVTQRVSHWSDGWSRDTYGHQVVSQHVGGDEITTLAHGQQQLYAPEYDCQRLVLAAAQGVNVYEVHNTHDHEEERTEEEPGLFGTTKKTTQIQSSSASSKGAKTRASQSFEVISGADINLTNVSLYTPKTDLRAPNGAVRLLLGTNHASDSRVQKSSSMLWQSINVDQNQHRFYSVPTITGQVVIHSPNDSVIQYVGEQQIRSYLCHIAQQVQPQHVISYLRQIEQVGGGKLSLQAVYEQHQRFHFEQEGPTGALVMLVALAVSIATANAGTAIAAKAVSAVGATGITAAVVSGMTVGTFSALCTQSAVALLQAKGDIGKANQILFSSQSLKEIGFGAISGGLMGGGASGTSLASFGGRVIQNTVNAGLRKAIFNENFEKAATQGVITAGISTVAANVAKKIGDAHSKQVKVEDPSGQVKIVQNENPIGYVPHKTLHTGLGAVTGGLSGGVASSLSGGKFEDGLARGAASGGFGALVGTIMTDAWSTEGDTQAQREHIAKMSDLLTATLAFAVGLDPTFAYQAANTASAYNFLAHREYLESIGLVQEGAEVYGEESDDPLTRAEERERKYFVEDYVDRINGVRTHHSLPPLSGATLQEAEAQACFKYGERRARLGAIDFAKDPRKYVPFVDGAYTVTKARFDHAFGDLSRAGLDAEISRGTQSLAVDGAIALTTLGVGKLVANAYRGAKTYFAGRTAARLAASESTALSKMPTCMTQSQNPKADVFKRVARDDWYVPQSQTGSRFLEFDARARAFERRAELGKGLRSAPKEIDGAKFGQFYQDHHIISDKHKLTKNHELVKLAEFDLQNPANKIFLPTVKGAKVSTTERSIHQGSHPGATKALATKMDKVVIEGQQLGWGQQQYQAKLLEIITAERQALRAGEIALNKNYRVKPSVSVAVGGTK